MPANHLRHITLPAATAPGRPWQPRLHLIEQTTGAADRARPVLYVHGATFPCENAVFFRFGGSSWADALNGAGYSVWGLDFAGYGRSERYPEMDQTPEAAGEPPGRAPQAAAQIERAVRAILARTGASRLSIIAHSWGSMPAGRFAGDHPELVDRLVMFGPVVRRQVVTSVPPLPAWRLLTAAEQKARFVEDVPAGQQGVLLEADFPAWAETFLGFDPTSAAREPRSVRTPNGPQADIMAAWSGALAYDPARIEAPVLIVRGAWDSVSNDGDAAWLKQALSRAALVADVTIPNATHLMHLETGRHALYETVTDFLDGRADRLSASPASRGYAQSAPPSGTAW